MCPCDCLWSLSWVLLGLWLECRLVVVWDLNLARSCHCLAAGLIVFMWMLCFCLREFLRIVHVHEVIWQLSCMFPCGYLASLLYVSMWLSDLFVICFHGVVWQLSCMFPCGYLVFVLYVSMWLSGIFVICFHGIVWQFSSMFPCGYLAILLYVSMVLSGSWVVCFHVVIWSLCYMSPCGCLVFQVCESLWLSSLCVVYFHVIVWPLSCIFCMCPCCGLCHCGCLRDERACVIVSELVCPYNCLNYMAWPARWECVCGCLCGECRTMDICDVSVPLLFSMRWLCPCDYLCDECHTKDYVMRVCPCYFLWCDSVRMIISVVSVTPRIMWCECAPVIFYEVTLSLWLSLWQFSHQGLCNVSVPLWCSMSWLCLCDYLCGECCTKDVCDVSVPCDFQWGECVPVIVSVVSVAPRMLVMWVCLCHCICGECVPVIVSVVSVAPRMYVIWMCICVVSVSLSLYLLWVSHQGCMWLECVSVRWVCACYCLCGECVPVHVSELSMSCDYLICTSWPVCDCLNVSVPVITWIWV